MKRIKAMNGYTIYELTQRDINNEFFNATAGNYNIYLSSDIREYGLTNSTPEYEDIETLEEAVEICDGTTATAIEIINNSDIDNTVENLEQVEEILTTAKSNNYLIGLSYIAPYSGNDDISVICIRYESLQAVIDDIRDNDEVITGITLRDTDGNNITV